jgi:hypothetical protein
MLMKLKLIVFVLDSIGQYKLSDHLIHLDSHFAWG